LYDILNRSIGLMQCGFDFAVGLEVGIRAVMKQVVGKRAAQALVEEHEQQRDFHALVGEAVGVVLGVAFEQGMGLELT
jgi:hypothetical protein